MKHIDDELIQKYIDNEVSEDEVTFLEKHLLTCDECRNVVSEQETLVNDIRGLINSLSEEEIEIPEFNKPKKNRIKRRQTMFLWSVGVASVACVLAFLFLNTEAKSTDDYKNLFYNTEHEFDANRSVLQQDIVIKVIDSEGRISEYNL